MGYHFQEHPQAGPGRPRGAANKKTLEVRDLARAIIDDPVYRTALAARVTVGEAPHMETLLWHYAYGKPVERVEVRDTTNELRDVSQDELRERALEIVSRVDVSDHASEGDGAVH